MGGLHLAFRAMLQQRRAAGGAAGALLARDARREFFAAWAGTWCVPFPARPSREVVAFQCWAGVSDTAHALGGCVRHGPCPGRVCPTRPMPWAGVSDTAHALGACVRHGPCPAPRCTLETPRAARQALATDPHAPARCAPRHPRHPRPLLLPLPVSLLYTHSPPPSVAPTRVPTVHSLPAPYCCPYPCPYCTLTLHNPATPAPAARPPPAARCPGAARGLRVKAALRGAAAGRA